MIQIRMSAILALIFLSLFIMGCSLIQPDKLPSTPADWVQGREGWIPPLPRGLEKPGPLKDEEWDKVLVLASSEEEISKQIQNNNILSTINCWVGYYGQPGYFYDSNSNISLGKAHISEKYTWYYPMISFTYHKKQGDSPGRFVGVDLATHRIVFTYNLFIIPDVPGRHSP